MKKLIPIIENIIIKRPQTNKTLVIEGIEESRALTTNLIPSFLEIILNGLNALKALKAFNDFSVELDPPG